MEGRRVVVGDLEVGRVRSVLGAPPKETRHEAATEALISPLCGGDDVEQADETLVEDTQTDGEGCAVTVVEGREADGWLDPSEKTLQCWAVPRIDAAQSQVRVQPTVG